ncbi:hypothetical protein AQF32_004600 [Listeria monocytogenes]|uniref:hypothetical protein n=1 Tax=Listeria monocytogenes TaxID=1639 RepID=UPI00070B961E|nr:hypothetical protein [Listeria monocytogenes]OYN60030.1 hypothetical protein AQF32_004600 [Listeria monocytogenes]
MDLKKWQDPLMNSELQQNYNDNLVKLAGSLEKANQDMTHVNQRISNLVIKSGGNESNEVVDARVSSLVPETEFTTLNDRISYAENALITGVGKLSTNVFDLMDKYNDIDTILKRLYGLDSSNIEIFVDDARGDDIAGTGEIDAPFKTINKAVMTLPRVLNSNSVNIWIVPGRYNEDVVIPPIMGGDIYIRSTNFETVDPTSSTGCQVRSISATGSNGYLYIAGLEETNTAGTTKNYFIKATRCGFVRITKCRMAFNTKAIDPFTAVFIDACSADVNGCYFASQNVDVRGYNTARVEVQNIVHGAKSAIGLYPQSADIFNLNSGTWEADTPTKLSGGGVVRT